MSKYTKIQAIFEMHQDEMQAQKMAKYMRNQFTFYGIPTKQRTSLTKTFLKEEKQNGIVDWGFLDSCYMDEHREFQYLVCDYLASFKRFICYQDIFHIETYIQTKSWWDTVDAFDRIIGDVGLKDRRVDDLMLEWSLDEDIWLRRVAIDHQLLRKEKTNTELLEKIIVNQWGSQEFFINKAIGWILRDYSKTNPAWVRDFIVRYHAKMHALSIREASKYL